MVPLCPNPTDHLATTSSLRPENADDRLTSCVKNGVTTEYVYDWMNRLIKRTVNGVTTRLIYNGWHVIHEVAEATGSVVRSYLHGPGTDENLAQVESNGTTYYLLTDHLGSTRAMVNETGAVVQRYHYSAYGEVTAYGAAGTTPVTNYLFTGREWEPASGLYNYRNRYYSAELGRFLQPDPIRFEGGDMNLFAYCFNSPINFNDSWFLFLLGCRQH